MPMSMMMSVPAMGCSDLDLRQHTRRIGQWRSQRQNWARMAVGSSRSLRESRWHWKGNRKRADATLMPSAREMVCSAPTCVITPVVL